MAVVDGSEISRSVPGTRDVPAVPEQPATSNDSPAAVDNPVRIAPLSIQSLNDATSERLAKTRSLFNASTDLGFCKLRRASCRSSMVMSLVDSIEVSPRAAEASTMETSLVFALGIGTSSPSCPRTRCLRRPLAKSKPPASSASAHGRSSASYTRIGNTAHPALPPNVEAAQQSLHRCGDNRTLRARTCATTLPRFWADLGQ